MLMGWPAVRMRFNDPPPRRGETYEHSAQDNWHRAVTNSRRGGGLEQAGRPPALPAEATGTRQRQRQNSRNQVHPIVASIDLEP
jgi:hypothetical protein